MAEQRLIHEKDERLGEDAVAWEVLASNVEIADSALARAKGLMFRSEIPEDFALVLDMEGGGLPFARGPSYEFVHMLFVKMPLDVIWTIDDEVVQTKTLQPWRGISVGKADRILELPAGAAEEVKPGDTVRLERPSDDTGGENEG